jgi:predicted nucleotidyltransferase
MITFTNCPQRSATERTVLEHFAAQAQQTLGENLVSIILFGSRARGDARPDSDVDLLLIVKNIENLSPVLERLDDVVLDLLLQYGLLLAIVPVEESEYVRQEFMWYRLVNREGVCIV